MIGDWSHAAAQLFQWIPWWAGGWKGDRDFPWPPHFQGPYHACPKSQNKSPQQYPRSQGTLGCLRHVMLWGTDKGVAWRWMMTRILKTVTAYVHVPFPIHSCIPWFRPAAHRQRPRGGEVWFILRSPRRSGWLEDFRREDRVDRPGGCWALWEGPLGAMWRRSWEQGQVTQAWQVKIRSRISFKVRQEAQEEMWKGWQRNPFDA